MGVFHAVAPPLVSVSATLQGFQDLFFTWAAKQPGSGSPGDDPLRSRTQLRLRHLHVYFANVVVPADLVARVVVDAANGATQQGFGTLDTNKALPLDPLARRTNCGIQRYRIVGLAAISPLYPVQFHPHEGVVRVRRPFHATWGKQEAPRFVRLDNEQWGLSIGLNYAFASGTPTNALVGMYLRFEENQF